MNPWLVTKARQVADGRQRVLFITRKWPPAVGGMETYCVELVAGLRKKVDLHTHSLPGRSSGATPAPIQLAAFGLHCAIKSLFGRSGFEIVHGGDMAIWPLVWLCRVRNRTAKLVLSAHGTDVALATRPGLAARIYRTYLQAGARLLPDITVIANSAATASLTKQIGFARVSIIRLAAKGASPQLASSIEPYLLFVGRLIRRKGCRWFIENVLPRLPQTMHLKVAGTIVDQSESQVLQNERVEYLGPIIGDQLDALRRNAMAVIVPNLNTGPECFEGFGLTAVEASRAGAVVIASAAFGLTDAVIGEQTGFLVPAGNADDWVEQIVKVNAWRPEERKSFVSRATKLSKETYDWSRVIDETLKTYETQSRAA